MKRLNFLLIAFCIVAFTACHKGNHKSSLGSKNDQKELLELYQHADSLYYKCGRIDTTAFAQFIQKAQAFADAHPKDAKAPEMLYRAGIGSMILAKAAPNREQTAKYAKIGLSIFYKFQETYPNDEHAKYCYYQRGVIYDDILGDWRSAEDQFRDFVNRYPNDSLAPQLEQYIKLLGKTESQIDETLNIQ
ncbi:MAG: hypothetical protein MJZ57_04150 [Bacteroidales bacterium]|nr:hypothetical protein [Bacteroidales bacterium]